MGKKDGSTATPVSKNKAVGTSSGTERAPSKDRAGRSESKDSIKAGDHTVTYQTYDLSKPSLYPVLQIAKGVTDRDEKAVISDIAKFEHKGNIMEDLKMALDHGVDQLVRFNQLNDTLIHYEDTRRWKNAKTKQWKSSDCRKLQMEVMNCLNEVKAVHIKAYQTRGEAYLIALLQKCEELAADS